jgi:hypothetical protein
MTSTASFLSAGEILKRDSPGRVGTPLAKRQEMLAAFDGTGMSAARFAAVLGMNSQHFVVVFRSAIKSRGRIRL